MKESYAKSLINMQITKNNLTKKINIGLIYSLISFSISVGISFYTYKYLWDKVDPKLLVGWFALFEISQFLLLMDLGFTHSFIRKNKNSADSDLKIELEELRGILAVSGFIATSSLLLIAFGLNIINSNDAIPQLMLALSVFVTLVSYAETALLRIKLRFKEIHIINILTNIIFIIYLIWGYGESYLDRLGYATFARSIIQMAAQKLILKTDYKIKVKKIKEINTDVISLNIGFFCLFLFDMALLAKTTYAIDILAILLVLRKYYDALRGLWDSLTSVLSIEFSQQMQSSRTWWLRCIVIASFAASFVFSEWIIGKWVNVYEINCQMNLAISTSAAAIVLFRMESMRSYFEYRLKKMQYLIGCLVVKVIFAILALNSIFTLPELYYLQAALLTIGVILMSRWKNINQG